MPVFHEPEVGKLLPAQRTSEPDAVQPVAFVEDQVILDVPLYRTNVGDAEMEAVGAYALTVTGGQFCQPVFRYAEET